MRNLIYNKKIILFILSICFVVTLIFRFLHPFKQQTVSKLTYTTENFYSKRTTSSDNKLDLLFNLSENKKIKNKKNNSKFIKDIFCNNNNKKKQIINQIKEKKIVKKPEKAIIKKPDIKEVIKNEFKNYQFFGFLIDHGNIILFIDRNRDILTVKKGDIIDGKYKVISITENFMQIRPTDFNENIIIDISNLSS